MQLSQMIILTQAKKSSNEQKYKPIVTVILVSKGRLLKTHYNLLHDNMGNLICNANCPTTGYTMNTTTSEYSFINIDLCGNLETIKQTVPL